MMFSFPQLLPDLPSFLLTQLHAPFSLSIKKKSKQKNQDKYAKTKQEKHKKAHEVYFF